MKIFKVMTVLFVLLAVAACGKKDNVKQADANYVQQLNAQNQAQLAKTQMATALAKACGDKEDSAWCVALVAQTLVGGKGMGDAATPAYKPRPTKGDIFLSKSLDLVGAALPFASNVIISKDSNKANVRISESRDQMMTNIVTSGFSGLTTLGSRDSTVVGGDYIIGNENGDGNRYGDGNIIGDGNISTGDDSLVGDSNILGDENVTGDANLFADGDSNVIGDDNTNTNGSDNAIDNEVGNDLFNSGGDNGDDDSTENNGDGGGG